MFRSFTCKAWKDVDPKTFRNGPQPGDKLGQADNMESFIVHVLGHKGNSEMACTGQEMEFISTNICLNGTARFLVVRDKLLEGNRVQHCTTQRMRTYISPLFDECYLKIKAPSLG